MKIELLLTGKTTEKWLNEGIEVYTARLKHYVPLSISYLPSSSAKTPERAVQEESEQILSRFKPRDFIVLLDEKGKELRSVQLAAHLEKWMLQGINRLVFVVGGAYGMNEELKSKADMILSLSKLTFTHQMIRLILVEQLYRAMTILRNESYHHE